MPKPICLRCNAEMSVARVGIVVQLNALASRREDGAYQQRRADTCKCPVCGTEMAFRFAEKGWEHFHTEPPETADVIVQERVNGRLLTGKGA